MIAPDSIHTYERVEEMILTMSAEARQYTIAEFLKLIAPARWAKKMLRVLVNEGRAPRETNHEPPAPRADLEDDVVRTRVQGNTTKN